MTSADTITLLIIAALCLLVFGLAFASFAAFAIWNQVRKSQSEFRKWDWLK